MRLYRRDKHAVHGGEQSARGETKRMREDEYILRDLYISLTFLF